MFSLDVCVAQCHSVIGTLQAAKEGEASKEQQLAELQAQLAAAQESAAAHKKQATSARGDLFALKASTKKSEKALTEENAKLKGELAQAKSLNETIRSSSQHVRVQLEAAKVRAATPLLCTTMCAHSHASCAQIHVLCQLLQQQVASAQHWPFLQFKWGQDESPGSLYSLHGISF